MFKLVEAKQRFKCLLADHGDGNSKRNVRCHVPPGQFSISFALGSAWQFTGTVEAFVG